MEARKDMVANIVKRKTRWEDVVESVMWQGHYYPDVVWCGMITLCAYPSFAGNTTLME